MTGLSTRWSLCASNAAAMDAAAPAMHWAPEPAERCDRNRLCLMWRLLQPVLPGEAVSGWCWPTPLPASLSEAAAATHKVLSTSKQTACQHTQQSS